MKHLVTYKNESAEAILNGKSTVDIRLSKTKSAPYGVVSSSDIILIKVAGKDIIGQFRVKKVITIDGVAKEDLADLKRTYNDPIVLFYGNIENETQAKYATVIFIAETSRFITSPLKISKKRLRKVWEALG